MSVQQLRPSRQVLELVRGARVSVHGAADVPTAALDEDELVDSLQEVAALESQVAALRLRLVQEADRREVAQALGATDTAAWAARLTGSMRGVMAGGLWLAGRLEERYHATREAFAEGSINEAQARVVVAAAEKLPEGVSDEQRRAAEEGLVVKAIGGMDPRRLRQAARRMLDVVSVELADRHEADLLVDEERRAERETWMILDDNGDGTFSGRFVIPELHGHLLLAALERLTAPQRLSRSKAGDLVVDGSLLDGGPSLSRTERLGLGICELIEHLPTEASGGFSRVSAGVLVHIDLQHLLDQVGSGHLDTGVHVSPGEVRRLACNAGIIPAVLGSRSEPLDLGFEARLHNTAMRRALSIVHDSCGTEGCERPFAWCDIHHPHPWSQGGPTSVQNGIPLCGYHHRRAHDERFTVRRLSTGEVRFHRRR